MRFRCPYCRTLFEPQAGLVCPACGKAVAVPSGLRPKAGAPDRRKRLSAELRQKQRELAKGADIGAGALARLTGSPRYVAVLVILFVVMGVVLTQRATRHHTEKVRRSDPVQHATYDLATLRTALELFRQDCGRYPSTRESLVGLLRHPGARGWDGPYIKTLYPDPWKNAYRYSLVRGEVRLTSDGPDGKPGTGDDLEAPPAPAPPAGAPVIPGQTAAPGP